MTRFALAALAFLLCSGGLVALAIIIWPPKPACLVVFGEGYEKNLALAHNHLGWEGLLGLAESTRPSGQAGFLWWGSRPLKLQQEPGQLDSLASLNEGLNFREKAVVLFLALHGGVDRQGA